jgi:hypothetical protein
MGVSGLEHFQEKWEPVFRFENATTQKDQPHPALSVPEPAAGNFARARSLPDIR